MRVLTNNEASLSRVRRDHRRLVAPVLGGFIALAFYGATLPPGLTWAHNGADGGDLLAAALTGGVPHPTGYPAYQLLLRAAIGLIGGEPAHTGAWLSAVCAALAVALLADLAQRAVRHGEPGHEGSAAIAGLTASLAWAASPGLWSQAVIVEVYALNVLICVALLWLAWRWSEAEASDQRHAERWLLTAGFVFGLGLGNHLTVTLMLPGLAVWLWTTARKRGLASRLRHQLGLAAVAMLAGLLVYLYLPLVARHRPAINWGDPSSLARLLWVATGRLYAGLAFGLPLADLPARLLGWANWTVRQFQPWGLLVVLAGLWRLDRTSRPWWITTLLIWLVFTIYAIGYNTTDSLVYLIPASAVMALWLAEAIYAALVRFESSPIAHTGLVLLAFAALPATSLANWQELDLRRDTAAREFLSAALREAEPNAVILTVGDERTFALWYSVYGLRQRPDIAILNVTLYGFEWYRAALAETHPNLLPSSGEAPPVASLIAALIGRRPVYAAENLDLTLPGVKEHQVGVLTQLSSP